MHITHVNAHTMYTVVIAAATIPGIGPYSPAMTVQTLEGGKCPNVYQYNYNYKYIIIVIVMECIFYTAPSSHPKNLKGYPINSTHIYLNWNPPHIDEINGILRQYKINVVEDSTGIGFQYTTEASTTEITLGPFHPDYRYHCTVTAYTVKEGPHTNILAIRTLEDGKVYVLNTEKVLSCN